MTAPTQLVTDLQNLASGKKKVAPGRIKEYIRDGYLELDEYESVRFTPRGAALRNGKVAA